MWFVKRRQKDTGENPADWAALNFAGGQHWDKQALHVVGPPPKVVAKGDALQRELEVAVKQVVKAVEELRLTVQVQRGHSEPETKTPGPILIGAIGRFLPWAGGIALAEQLAGVFIATDSLAASSASLEAVWDKMPWKGVKQRVQRPRGVKDGDVTRDWQRRFISAWLGFVMPGRRPLPADAALAAIAWRYDEACPDGDFEQLSNLWGKIMKEDKE